MNNMFDIEMCIRVRVPKRKRTILSFHKIICIVLSSDDGRNKFNINQTGYNFYITIKCCINSRILPIITIKDFTKSLFNSALNDLFKKYVLILSLLVIVPV